MIEHLQDDLYRLDESFSGEMSVSAVRLDREDRIDYKPDIVLLSASIIKIPILTTLLKKASTGQVDLDHVVSVPQESVVRGSGVLKALHAGAEVTLNDLAVLMTIVSDNTATNMLIDLLGTEAVNAELAQMGFTQTRLERKMYDWQAREDGRENWCTAEEIAELLARLVRGEVLPEFWGERVIAIMRDQIYRHKIPFLLPDSAVVANKTGEISGHSHDAAVVRDGELLYTICINTRGGSASEAAMTIARASKIIYDYWKSSE